MTTTSHYSQRPGWEIAWAQRTGIRHSATQDRLGFQQPEAGGLYLSLADGVGGGSCGEVAAQACVDHCLAFNGRLNTEALHQWLAHAEQQVQQALRSVTLLPGASTVVAAWLGNNGRGFFSWVGDARLHKLDAQQHRMQCLTQDHTYDQCGIQPPSGSYWDDLALMIGTGLEYQAEVHPIQLEGNEILLMSSDGMHQFVTLSAMRDIIRENTLLEQACYKLVDQAYENGSEDDISVLLVVRRAPRLSRLFQFLNPFKNKF